MIVFGKRLTLAFAAAVVCLSSVSLAPAQGRDFEVPVFLSPGRNQDQSPSVNAGAHPFELFTYFAVDRSPTADELPSGGFEGPTANVKDLRFVLPEGMTLNAAAFPQCTKEAFNSGNCSAAAQVGVAGVSLADGQGTSTTPIFNVAPPPGMAAQFAYRANLSAVYVNFHLKSGSDYAMTADVNGLSAAFGLLTSSMTIWGVPGEAGHDALRFTGTGQPAPGPYPEPAPLPSAALQSDLLRRAADLDAGDDDLAGTERGHIGAPLRSARRGRLQPARLQPDDRSEADDQPRRLTLRPQPQHRGSPEPGR